MKIALAQINPFTGDLSGNTNKICKAIDRARHERCDLVVLPETAVTGYMSCDLLEIDNFVRTNIRMLHEKIVARCDGITAVVGYVEFSGRKTSGDRLHNAAAVIQNRRIIATAHKQNLCRYRYYDETRYFASGNTTAVVSLSIGGVERRMGILICEDLWDRYYPANPYMDAVNAGAEMIIVINASPFEVGKWNHRIELVQRHQQSAPLPVVYVNATAIGDNLKDLILFDGRSMVVDGRGSVNVCAPLFRDDLQVAELDDRLRGRRGHVSSWTEEEELYESLIFALREYCRQTGFKQVLLGVSGGIDSSLCAALSAEALGRENVLGVSLPSEYSSADTRRSAEAVCRNLGIDFRQIPISSLHQESVTVFERQMPMKNSVTDENIQARLRGLLLMALANETGRMVIATGNKTELGLGYCTLYGDMVGGLLLIGDINKMQVYRLAEYINQRAGRQLIPPEVLNRRPSAELARNQEDPFDYPVVAPLIDDLIARVGPGEIMGKFRRGKLDNRYPHIIYDRYDENTFRQVIADTYRRYVTSAFKRAQSSPTVIVSSRALGFDLRETIINQWRPQWD